MLHALICRFAYVPLVMCDIGTYANLQVSACGIHMNKVPMLFTLTDFDGF